MMGNAKDMPRGRYRKYVRYW